MSNVANEIIRQLGGRKFLMMTGAKNMVSTETSLMFSINRGANKGINKVRITLNGKDLYDIEFMKFSPRKLICMTIHKAEDIENVYLQSIFTNHTGFDTRL